jgi:hypothetical protein
MPANPSENMKKKPTPIRGGARKGAGRPPGSTRGRTVTSKSICLPPAIWTKLDKTRGKTSRSAYLAKVIADL